MTPAAPADAAAKTPAIQADAIVVGAGLVGATQALAFAEAGLDVVMLDAQDPAEGLDAAFDGRASAIAGAAQRILVGLGLWPELAADAGPINDIRVSESGSRLFLHYDHRAIGDDPFGWMIENRNLRRALYRATTGHPRIRIMAPVRLAAMTRGQAAAEATLEDGRRLRAPLIVGADGRGSWVRRTAGIRVTQWSYDQVGIVCTVLHERPHDGVAHEHFIPSGPFAILPLKGDGNRAGRLSSIVWTEQADLGQRIVAYGDARFQLELEERFGDFLGSLEVIGPRWAYPLSLQYAERSVDARLALIGDADHGMHPIAGQGFNMGLRDVAALAEAVADARRLGLDHGGDATLERYRRWRRFDNTLMLAATDGLNRLFSNNFPPIRLARDLGLGAVQRIPPLKRLFMRHAVGDVGELPRLMRGEPL